LNHTVFIIHQTNHLRSRVNQVLLDMGLQLPYPHVQASDILQRAERQFVNVAMLGCDIAKQNLHSDILELRLDLDRLPTHDHDNLLLIVQHVHLRVQKRDMHRMAE